jgi:hypothetical protein
LRSPQYAAWHGTFVSSVLLRKQLPRFLAAAGLPRRSISWRTVAIGLAELTEKRREWLYRSKRPGGKAKRVGRVLYYLPAPAGTEPAN